MRQRSAGERGLQRRAVECLVDVFHHRRRLRQDEVTVHHRRDRAVGVDRQVLG